MIVSLAKLLVLFVVVLSLFSHKANSQPDVIFYSNPAKPLAFIDDNGVPSGAFIELAEMIFQQSGLIGEIHFAPWARANEEIKK